MEPGTFLILAVALAIAVALWNAGRKVTTIYPPNIGLLYRDGTFVRELPPGRHSRFDFSGRTKVVEVFQGPAIAPLGETNVLSKDQFAFRVTLAPVVKVVDARLYIESQPVAGQAALNRYMPLGGTHPMLQSLVAAAAIEVAATRTLAEMLADTMLIPEALQVKLADSIPGAVIERVLVTAVNLPPETRKMFTDVERAKMEGQAGLERARGEQAALRVLANAARLLNDNPSLANLRLLQAVETAKGATIVIGNPGFDTVKGTSTA